MSSQLAEVGPGDVPHVDGGVVAGGQEDPPGEGDADTGEAGLGAGRRVLVDLLVPPDVPQPHRLVLAAADKAQAGRMDRDRVDISLVTPERLNTLGHTKVPQSRCSRGNNVLKQMSSNATYNLPID